MDIDFEGILIGIDGKPLVTESKAKATLSHICKAALLSATEKNIPGKEKFDRWELAKKLTGVVSLKTEEIAKIKEVVGEVYATSVVGPAFELLEKEHKKKEKK